MGGTAKTTELLDAVSHRWMEIAPGFDTRIFQLATALMIISQQVEIDFRSTTQALDPELGVGDLRLLLVVRREDFNDGIRAIDLLDRLFITSGAITKQLTRLEEKGYIVRVRTGTRRGRSIRLTSKGLDVVEQLIARGQDGFPTLARAFEALPPDLQAQGMKFSRALLDAVHEERVLSEISLPGSDQEP